MIDWIEDHWIAVVFGAGVFAFWVLPMLIFGWLAWA